MLVTREAKRIGQMEGVEMYRFIIQTILSSCVGGTCNLNTELGSMSISQAQVQLEKPMMKSL